MHCGIPARTGKSNRGDCADTSQDLHVGTSLKEMLFHLLHCGLTHGCHVDQFLFTFQFPLRGHPSTNHVMSCLILPLVGQQTQRADPSTRSKNSCSILQYCSKTGKVCTNYVSRSLRAFCTVEWNSNRQSAHLVVTMSFPEKSDVTCPHSHC